MAQIIEGNISLTENGPGPSPLMVVEVAAETKVMSTGSNKNWIPPVRRVYEEPDWQNEADVKEKAKIKGRCS